MSTWTVGIVWLCFLVGSFSPDLQDPRTQYFPRVQQKPAQVPDRDNLWVFILAGQSNMAGRGQVHPQDTVQDERILTINKSGEIIVAKEPLHFYEPNLRGLDCGLSFGRALLKQVPADISVLLLPTAVGGSTVSQWLGDSLHREVRLMSNFSQKAALGKQYGQIKAILWHQGESDAHSETIPYYKNRITKLFAAFREIVDNDDVVILSGELGSYSDNPDNWQKINDQIRAYAATDARAATIPTSDLHHKGDKIHFDADGQRALGERFAQAYISLQKN